MGPHRPCRQGVRLSLSESWQDGLRWNDSPGMGAWEELVQDCPTSLLQSSGLFCLHVVLLACATLLSRRWYPLFVLLFIVAVRNNCLPVACYIRQVLTLSYVSA